MSRKGQISIHTENIFPIIKKWMYSEKDIFLREIVSNASDAISKFKKLVSLGEASIEDGEAYRITVALNKTAGTISITDNGIGMTEDEVEKYITQIAFSGAEDFAAKYANESEDTKIIGHFGLGFYSAFMVSNLVEIDTLSYQEGAAPVHWESDGNTEYSIGATERELRGTTVTMHINEDCTEFLDLNELKKVLHKYFSFLPVEIYAIDEEEEAKRLKELEEAEAKKADIPAEEGEKQDETAPANNEPQPLNDTNPLWLKSPSECTDEEYKEFYRSTFMDFNDPLFWVHINLDYPFNLKGILYFPKLKHEYETIEGQIKLYNNQVFVADNLKEVIPEFLTLLKGCIDCPDLPLNVSRSFLQNDGTVKKLSTHITKKVSDKLKELFKKQYEDFCKYWDDIHPFVKYGCLKEEKFYENVKDILIFKTIEDKYVTVNDYVADGVTSEEAGADSSAETTENNAEPKTIFYTDNTKEQAQYISMFKEQGLDAVVLETMIDSHFISFLEMKNAGKIKFMRIDSDIAEAMKSDKPAVIDEEVAGKMADMVKELLKADDEEFKKENGTLKVEVKPLKTEGIPSVLQQSEESRRMEQFAKMYGNAMMGMGNFPKEETLLLNANNPLVIMLSQMDKEEEKAQLISEHLYDLAVLSTRQLSPDAMKKFIERSTKLLMQ